MIFNILPSAALIFVLSPRFDFYYSYIIYYYYLCLLMKKATIKVYLVTNNS